jgi:hypothetical protein
MTVLNANLQDVLVGIHENKLYIKCTWVSSAARLEVDYGQQAERFVVRGEKTEGRRLARK